MPAEQAFLGERLVVFLGGVEHHLDDALDIAVGGREGADIHAEAAGDRGAHLILVEDFAFDLAGFEDVLGQGLEDGLRAELEAEPFHPADEPPLPVTHGRKLVRQPRPDPSGTSANASNSWM